MMLSSSLGDATIQRADAGGHGIPEPADGSPADSGGSGVEEKDRKSAQF